MAKTATKDVTETPVVMSEPDAQLPAVITEQVKKKGDLIDVSSFTPEEINQAKQIAAEANLSDTNFILNFAADPQRDISDFLDELMGDIRVKDAGVAGDMSMQMAEGIDLMSLEKVRDQIQNPPSSGFFARIWRAITGWTNYIEAFYHAKKPVESMIDKIERQANNRTETLKTHSGKLDLLTERSGVQVKELAVWIAASEAILVGALDQYATERKKVLKSKDPLAASQLRDMARQIAAFEKRALEVKIAYVKAGSVTIPQIRMVQEAIVIEIQNISEQILFQLPDFKAGIVQVAALNDVAEAQKAREQMDENQRKLNEATAGLGQAIYTKAKESQGSPLDKVERLEVTISGIKAGIEGGIELEEKTRQQRQEAEEILVGLKDVVTDALKAADLSAVA